MKIFTKLFALLALMMSLNAYANAPVPSKITPESGLITNGQTVELTFDTYVDWYLRVTPTNNKIVFNPLNGSASASINVADYQGAEVNYKTVKVKLQVPDTGYDDVTEWELIIPENQIVNGRTNEPNKEIRVKFNGESNAGTPVESMFNILSVDPQPGVIDAPLRSITMLLGADYVTVNEARPITVTGNNGNEFFFTSIEGNLLTITLNITESGVYTVAVPEGALVASNGNVNAAWTGEYIILAEPVAFVPVSITPDPEKKVTAPFQRIDILYPAESGEVDVNPFGFNFTGPDGRWVNGVQIFTLGNLVVFDSFNVTAPGEYKLELNSGFAYTTKDSSVAMTIVWTVDNEDGIFTIVGQEINTAERYYDMQGRQIEHPVKGTPVIRIDGSSTSKIIY